MHPTTFDVFSEEEFDFLSIHRRVFKNSFGRHVSEKLGNFFVRNCDFCIFWGKFQADILNKRQTALDVSRKKASQNFRRADPIIPFPGSHTLAKVLITPFSVFRRDGLRGKTANFVENSCLQAACDNSTARDTGRDTAYVFGAFGQRRRGAERR